MRECSDALYLSLLFYFTLGTVYAFTFIHLQSRMLLYTVLCYSANMEGFFLKLELVLLISGFVSLRTAISKASGSCDCGKSPCTVNTKCNFTEGANDFTCFIKNGKMFYICEWKPGDISTSYTLCIKQRKCRCANVNQKNTTSIADGFRVIPDYKMTAYVIATSEDQRSCTYKRLSGLPSQMKICSPPSAVVFERKLGNMYVQVKWGEDETHITQKFSVKYREFNSTEWKEQLSINNIECYIWNLTSFLSYEMQIQCITNADCSQCPPGEVIIVPRELTDAPYIQHEIQDHVKDPVYVSAGQRKVIVKWKYAHSEAVTYYIVTVRKVSGESIKDDSFTTKDATITLFLSYSSYNFSIRAFNSAGSSPAASIIIDDMDDSLQNTQDWFGPFNVSIKSNNSFSLWWNSSASSVCFSVEWWARGQIPAFRSFYMDTWMTHKEITEITESIFQPYVRYYFVLHKRSYKDTCNMKNINDSEITYGTSQAYLTEGIPISAPGNVTVLNITQHSSVITWSPVPEEDLRGFLLGYKIYHIEDDTESFTVMHPSLNSFQLQKLKSNSAYRVQLAAFTAAGEGQRSEPKPFVTNMLEYTALSSIIAAVIVGIIILLLAVHLSCRLLHRAKKLLWPSIPNPGNSNAVQKIENGHELNILEPLIRKKLEESEACDPSAVCVVERKKEASLLSSSSKPVAVVKPTVLHLSEEEDSTSTSEEMATTDTPTFEPNKESVPTENFPMNLINIEPTLSASMDSENDAPEDSSKSQIDSPVKPAVVFMSDYTTMEFFQQVARAGIQSTSFQTGQQGLVFVHPGQDYVRQSSYAENKQCHGQIYECK
ncbi:interleukin-12 receptor subunit beta-2 isoform X2 [Paramisgurnus dabryanus]|uniref:interleukin-12 receptor subunit beta-2 isoform X2 n=1 Tax=Paramisgurnus dabryanus TaxID=90735 RepID=UPI0031F3E974